METDEQFSSLRPLGSRAAVSAGPAGVGGRGVSLP